jgi:hypothetical protein
LQKILVYSIYILTLSCTYLPDPIGNFNEIIVIVSPEDKILVEPYIQDLFSHTIFTPQPEKEFFITYKNPWEIENVSKFGNLFFVSLDFPQDSTGDLLMQRIISRHKQNEPLFILENLYAKNQTVCAVHTLDAVSFQNVISENKKWILDEFQNTMTVRFELSIFKNGKNDILSDKVNKMFGYTLDLQPDYKIIKSDSLKPFIWLGRGYPYRWITIHRSERDKYRKPVDAWEEVIKVYAETMPDIHIGTHFRSSETINYHIENRKIMRGVYEHDESESGGPFFVYIFDTETANEVILVSGFVNYPGHEKFILLKQLEIIANTLHQGEII